MILDTNALSAFAEAHAGAAAMIGKARFIALPVIVLGEYRFGIAQSRRREEYERWLERLLPDCRVLDIGPEVARRFAEVRLELKRWDPDTGQRCLDRRLVPPARASDPKPGRALRSCAGYSASELVSVLPTIPQPTSFPYQSTTLPSSAS